MYWYVSRTKIEALAQAKRRPGALRAVALKLKSPILEVSAEMELDDRLQRDLRWVRKHYDANPEVRDFDALGDEPGPLFAFDGRAARTLAGDVYLLALARGESALILAGSRWHILGEERDASSAIGGSIDPISAVLSSFAVSNPSEEALTGLSFAWQSVMRQSLPEAVMPRIAGLALFGGSFQVDRRQSRRVSPDVTRVVVGSPVYVEQT